MKYFTSNCIPIIRDQATTQIHRKKMPSLAHIVGGMVEGISLANMYYVPSASSGFFVFH